MKTSFPTNEEALANRKWFAVDGTDKVVGRLASKIAQVLRGKHNPAYTPHNDSGDFVIVTNVDKITFTGNKNSQKKYFRHTGYIGGIKETSAASLLDEKPEEVLRKAVKGMLPKTSLGRAQLAKLKMYSGAEHPHAAQQPEDLSV